MSLSIRRLTPGDEPILTQLAVEDAAFDVTERGEALTPPTPRAARAYLADPNVLHWIAEQAGIIVGHLYCNIIRKRDRAGAELVLYEIGVRLTHRRQKIGRALLDQMYAWMKEHEMEEVWVLADNPGAVGFYKACGFEIEEEVPVYMVHDSGE